VNITIKGEEYEIISEEVIKIHSHPLPKEKGERFAKQTPEGFYTAVLTRRINGKPIKSVSKPVRGAGLHKFPRGNTWTF